VPHSIIAPRQAQLRLTSLAPDDLTPFMQTVRRGFHGDYDPEVWEHKVGLLEPHRAFGMKSGDRWVATCLALGQTLTVPGGQVPSAAVTYVTVAPAYRRQGLLRRMMTHQLTDLRDQGREHLALLWATEGDIYGRFGYGLPAPALALSGSTRDTAFLPSAPVWSGSVDEVDREVFEAEVPGLRARLTADRPGALRRDDRWWHYTLADPEPLRRGASGLRFALQVDDSGGLDGYLLFRTKEPAGGGRGAREAVVVELEAGSAGSAAALWRYLLDLDLVGSFSRPNAPMDDPLRWLVASQRAVHTELLDGPNARIIDVTGALSARTYSCPFDIVLEVQDPMLDNNAGRFRVEGSPDGASVTRVVGAPDLTLSVRDLATLYLGGSRATTLVRAGLVGEHRDGAATLWDAAAAGPRAPFCDDRY